MKKFEGWRTEELQFVAALIAGRDMVIPGDRSSRYYLKDVLYGQLIREIRNRRVKEELFQMKLKTEVSLEEE